MRRSISSVVCRLLVLWAWLEPASPQRVPVEPIEDLAAVVERATRVLLGREYRVSPLGEGKPPDSDPRFRLDAFDCTTFAETALALALAGEPDEVDEVLSWLDRLRYEERRADFESRRHLMTTQWLPGLQALGVLLEVTDEVAGEAMPRVRLELDLTRWHTRSIARELVLPDERIPVGSFDLPYVPLDRATEILVEAPAGLLLNVVRVPSPNAPIVITHQALVLENEQGERVVRHASARYGRVLDQRVESFVADLERPKEWPIAGVNLQRLTRPTSPESDPIPNGAVPPD